MSAQLLWQRPNTQNVIFLNPINSIDNTKLSWYTLPLRQHHSFFRNLPPLFIYNYHNSTGIKKNNNNNNKNHHDSQRLTKCDPPYDFRDKGDRTHNMPTHRAECPLFLRHLLTVVKNILICNVKQWSVLWRALIGHTVGYAGFPPQGTSL